MRFHHNLGLHRLIGCTFHWYIPLEFNSARAGTLCSLAIQAQARWYRGSQPRSCCSSIDRWKANIWYCGHRLVADERFKFRVYYLDAPCTEGYLYREGIPRFDAKRQKRPHDRKLYSTNRNIVCFLLYPATHLTYILPPARTSILIAMICEPPSSSYRLHLLYSIISVTFQLGETKKSCFLLSDPGRMYLFFPSQSNSRLTGSTVILVWHRHSKIKRLTPSASL